MSDRRRRLLRFLGLVAAALILVLVVVRRQPPPAPLLSPPPNSELSPPPYSDSPYLNTRPEARYIGGAACAECHPRQHQSYLLTAHSRALGDPDLEDEPPDGGFFHKDSGRSYRVYRKGSTLRHEEVVRNAADAEVARLDVPIRYRIGSGNFTRSYLVEIDGFLHESPITWYAGKKKWDMSPGYNVPRHHSFERPVGAVCLACHAGRVEAAQESLHRMIIHEKAISCENCHGPGSLHQDRHRSGKFNADERDWTIVNPGKLSQPLLEAICSNCHLSGAASTLVRGRQPGEFRPGRPLTDYRLIYHLDSGTEQMTVVGHMEQLRRSVCYQKSSAMTCLTCHDPHQRTKPQDALAFYRKKCLSCHDSRNCGLDEPVRVKKQAGDNCIACHMPRGDTDIPHISFTHHRIGIHPAPKSGRLDHVPELVVDGSIEHLGPLDRKRNLGLAYILASHEESCAPYAQIFLQRALGLLEEVYAAGLHQDEAAAALVELTRDQDFLKKVASSLRHAPASAPAHVRAQIQFQAALSELDNGAFDAGIDMLKELTKKRRYADDWRFLGMAYLDQDQPAKALPAFHQALSIRPFRSAIHKGLGETYRRLGETRLSEVHRDKAEWLKLNYQD